MSCRDDDPYAERRRICRTANELARDDSNHVNWFPETWIESIQWHGEPERFEVRLSGRHAGEVQVDRVIANVGYRSDNSLHAELQISHCPRTGVPANFAAARTEFADDYPVESLINPEPHFYVLGAKATAEIVSSR